MKPQRRLLLVAIFGALHLLPAPAGSAPFSTNANRLTYLDSDDPFYPNAKFPKLTTPQWVGEPGVEAVVILSIDDMRDTARYETFLRSILERLKQIDGRAPVSIMVNAVTPTNAQLQTWLKEGLSLEVHTLVHPCPCLAKGDFNAAANTYHGCVELMNQIPGNKPVAFRMPCCDSMNSLSPRFLAEIFNRVNSAGQFLTIDSSVFCLLTTNDPALPRELVLDADGREKFRKYFPAETNAITKVSLKNYAGYIEDYPYPYVVGKLCWEFPAMVPSDWEAFNVFGPTNATLLADWKSALDAVVLKQGVMPIVFHPHGWSSPRQFVEFIDYAVAKHGKKVKFLTFKEAQERLNKNIGELRTPKPWRDHGTRLIDLNNDGFLDVIEAAGFVNGKNRAFTRVWNAESKQWSETPFPHRLADTRARFGIMNPTGFPTVFWFGGMFDSQSPSAVTFDGKDWRYDRKLDYLWHEALADMYRGRATNISIKASSQEEFWSNDNGVRLRDLDHDGVCELIFGFADYSAIGKWQTNRWRKLDYALPRGTSIADAEGRDAGLRFVDVNGDGYDDVLFSNEDWLSLHLFIPKANPRLMWEVGWNDDVWSGKRGESDIDIPPIVRAGTNRNNGVWFKNGAMWIQNEDTAHLPDKVRRLTFRELLTADQPPPLSPEQALQSMRPRPGFKVELVATEPLVVDPIAFDWGADGRLWVVDMFDYPLGRVDAAATNRPTRRPNGEEILTPPGGGSYAPGGRIKVIEDSDGDGRYDKMTVFLDNVNFPTGLLPWRNGVLVAAAPEIFYAEDTDGDGKADKRTTLFTGFVEGNQQHRLNGFDYGLDNWIYGANGESGGSIRVAADVRRLTKDGSRWVADAAGADRDQSLLTSPATGAVNLRGHDFRFRPDTGEFEAIEGTTQYGRHRDDWGNWFGNNNPTWLWHYHIPERYVARNPHLAVKSTKQMLAQYPDGGRVFPAIRMRQRFNDHHHSNHVTAANSPTPYRDDLFGPEFATSVFISDPVHNLIHREVLEPDGVTFTSHRAPGETNNEFLASTDAWFRPTMLKTGPDGALYIADMYRLVIEHPEWIPKWIQQRLDLRAGSDMGRIYRVFPESVTLRKIPNLAKLDTVGLVAALDSPNGWQRDTAQRLLVERKDKSAVEGLQRLGAAATNAKVRLQALCTLEGMGSLDLGSLAKAFADPHSLVRQSALRLAEPFAEEVSKAVATSALPAAFDPDQPDLRVRYQLAFSLGQPGWASEVAGPLLARLALKDFDTPAMQVAINSSAPPHVERLLRTALVGAGADKASPALVEQLLGLATALDKRQAIIAALRAMSGQPRHVSSDRFNALAALLDALERRNITLREFAGEMGPEAQASIDEIERLIPLARAVSANNMSVMRDRLAAIRLLARGPEEHEADLRTLGQLLGAQNSSLIHKAALTALARQKDRAAADVLLAGWKGQGPALRTEVLNVLLGRPDWCRALLAMVQKGDIPAGQIGAAFQQKLLNHADSSVKRRAEEVFTAVSKDRQGLFTQYAGVAKLTGNAEIGMALFRQQCATCHRLRGEGSEVGPDLGALASKGVETFILAILDPNQAVEARYANYTAVTKDGREVGGIITAETANSVTLRAPGGREETLLRSELNGLVSSALSLMPEGLEKALGPQEMADLIAALRNRD